MTVAGYRLTWASSATVFGRLFGPSYALLLRQRTHDLFAIYWQLAEDRMAGWGDAHCSGVRRRLPLFGISKRARGFVFRN